MAAVALMEADERSLRAAFHDADGRADRHPHQLRPRSTSWPRQRGIDWFRSNVITKVPFPHPGFMRDVYPGFLQLHGFISMNLDRHIEAHRNLFLHLVKGDGDSAQKHREFYDEYLAVMDLTAEFYLQTVDTVFVRHALPKGEMTHRGRPIDPGADHARRAAHGRRRARRHFRRRPDRGRARAVRRTFRPSDKAHYLQPGVGHYGVFNGSRFRAEIAPRIADFVLSHNGGRRRAATALAGKARGAESPRHAGRRQLSRRPS